MMRIRLIGASLVSLIAAAGGVSAADLAASAVPPVDYVAAPAMFDWGGAYFGAVGGYGWASSGVEVTIGPGRESGTLTYDGAVGGAFAGYNWQAGAFVGGLEGDIMASGMAWKARGGGIENNWNGTFRARAGVAFGGFMPYVTAGVGFGGIDLKVPRDSDSRTGVGWVAGGGAEVALSKNLTFRAEYRYTDYGTDTYRVHGEKIDIGFDSSEVLTGLAFKF
ncbi:MAG: porin family protein [Bauldia sp.]|nr:porin family protein [Bauldia sp.]